MPRKEESMNSTLGNNESIVKVLKEQNEIIQTVTSEVNKIISTLKSGDFESFVRVEKRITQVQNEVEKLSKILSTVSASSETNSIKTETAPKPCESTMQYGTPAVIQCKVWQEFQEFASGAENVSFAFREADRTFEADALKNNSIVAYIGSAPGQKVLLKAWLSQQMNVAEPRVFEGSLAKV
jgi:hypothetical protein